VPLESFIGPAVDALLVRATEALGADAEIIAVRTLRTADGRVAYQVLAGDADCATEERRRMGPDGGSHPLLKSNPGIDDLAHTRARG
jgi:hypothetical protein